MKYSYPLIATTTLAVFATTVVTGAEIDNTPPVIKAFTCEQDSVDVTEEDAGVDFAVSFVSTRVDLFIASNISQYPKLQKMK